MARPRRNDFLIPLLAVCSDLVAIVAAFWSAYIVRFYGPLQALLPPTKGMPELSAYILGACAVAPVWMLLFNGRKVYRSRRDVDPSSEFFSVLRVVSFGMLVVMSLAFFYRDFSYSRLVFALIWVLSIVYVFAGRLLVLQYEKHLYKRGRELRNLLLVGANQVANKLAVSVSHHPAKGYALRGYLSEGEARIESVSSERLGDFDALTDIVDEHRIETIIVCLSADESSELNRILTLLEGKSVQLLLQSDVLGITPTRLRVNELFGMPMLGVKDVPMGSWGRIAKRVFDIVFSGLVLLLFAPFAALIMLLVRLESGSPVFYKQIRIGLDGEEFMLYKFRTMRVDAEKETGPTWTKKGDPRVTRIGKVLRRLSMDEIPQFLNVLRGEMSVVGPRPERPEFVNHFSDYVPKYIERHRLKTGLTGWAQVNGLRGEAPIAERTRYDLFYIENWSFVLDIRIIFKTVYAVLFGKDAY